MESRGLEAEALEREGRLAFIDEVATGESREEALRRMSEAGEGHSVWAAFDWAGRGDRESVLREQWKLTSFIAGRQVVIKTAILEETLEGWPPEDQRHFQTWHSETLWVSREGLSLSRTVPLPGG